MNKYKQVITLAREKYNSDEDIRTVLDWINVVETELMTKLSTVTYLKDAQPEISAAAGLMMGLDGEDGWDPMCFGGAKDNLPSHDVQIEIFAGRVSLSNMVCLLASLLNNRGENVEI